MTNTRVALFFVTSFVITSPSRTLDWPMIDLITNNVSYEEGSAYGIVVYSDDYKDVAYGSGPWPKQDALLYAINSGLAATGHNTNARVHLPGKQLANYIAADLPKQWKQNDWTHLNGSTVTAPKQWDDLMSHSEMRDIEWVRESDHPMMSWARKCAFCAIAEVNVRELKSRQEIKDQRTVSPEQAQQFWMVAEETGYTEKEARQLLTEYGVISAKDVAKPDYDSLMQRAESKVLYEGD
jgi:ribonuclease HI